MYRIHLSEEQLAELQRRTNAAGVAPRTRNRLEMVRLAHAGFTIPWIARHLQRCEPRVRHWVKQFLTGGFDALDDQPHLGPTSGLTPEIVAALKQHLLQSQQTFTTAQIADWIEAKYDVSRSTRQVSRVLTGEKLSYKRTARSLKQKQDPEAVARRAGELKVLEKGELQALDLCHLDEAGFAPTLCINYSWSPVGERLHLPYEAPQGRRVNVIGAYFSHGVMAGEFYYESYVTLPKLRGKQGGQSREQQATKHGVRPEEVGPIDSARFLSFVWRAAGRPEEAGAKWKRERLLIVVLDNYSVHKSAQVKAEEAALLEAGVILWYLPPYSPHLSAIERIWQAIKHREMQQRSYAQVGELKQGVDEALGRKALALRVAHAESAQCLRRAA